MKLMEIEGFTALGHADDHQFVFAFQIDFQASVTRRTIPSYLDLIGNE